MTDLFEAETTTTTSLDLRRLQRQKRRATRRKWALVLVSLGLVLVAMGGSIAYNFVQGALEKEDVGVADYEGLGQGTIQVEIKPGDTGAMIAQTLYDNDVVASVQAFTKVYSDSADAQGIKPGFYFMQRQMKAEYALALLLDSNNRDLRKINVPEGKTLPFYFQKIADLTGATVDEVKAAAEDTEKLGLPAEANGNLEGWLFPATYEFNPGVTPTAVLQAMVKKTIDVLDAQGVAPENRQTILTIASLVEMEAKLPEDRPLIAGVIYNRLDQGWKLELDSTVKYVSPDTEGAFITNDEKAIDSPYNTYMYAGPPPAPISGAGESSIAAAVAPASHDYMFFVTVNLHTGETAYAATISDHQKNVQQMRAWIDANLGDS